MSELTLQSPYVTHRDIDQCITYFESIKNSGKPETLRIVAQRSMDDIDLLLIGYFILFRQAKKDLEIHLVLPHNLPSERTNSLRFKLLQFNTYAYMLTGQAAFSFSIQGVPVAMNLQEKAVFPEGTYVLSDHFMLFLLVARDNPDLYQLLFEQDPSAGASHWYIDDRITWEDKNDQLYQLYHDSITHFAPVQRLEAIKQLGKLAFLKSLKEAYITPYFIGAVDCSEEQLKGKRIYAGNLSQRTEKGVTTYDAFDYYAEVKAIFDDLRSKPLIYHFIYSTLVSSELLPSALNHQSRKTFTQTLYDLWKFAKELAHGLKELAKNILEHSSTGVGIITARIFHQQTLETLRSPGASIGSIYQHYLHSLLELGDTELAAILDLHVSDLGEKGVLATLRDKTQAVIREGGITEDLQPLMQEDIRLLESNDMGIANLLSPDTTVLNQQSKRSIAHFGLLTFCGLVRANKGLLIASSQTLDGGRETVVLPDIGQSDYNILTAGTRYSVMLPIFAGTGYKAQLPDDFLPSMESSALEIKGLENLFDVELVYPEEPLPAAEDARILLVIPLLQDHIHTREQENLVWQTVIKGMNPAMHSGRPHEKILINLDFDKASMNGSQLLRLIGKIQVAYPRVSMIFSNLKYMAFSDLQKINASFAKLNSTIPYWNEKSLILIYHYIDAEDGGRFYFTDALWGKEEADCLKLNKLIHRNHFNATTIANPVLTMEEREPNAAGRTTSPDISLWGNAAFYNRSVLLPFDLLLTGGNDRMTIFEHNALVLLKSTIKPNTIL